MRECPKNRWAGRPSARVLSSSAAALLTGLALGSCRDDLAPPTQGFIAVRTGAAFQVGVTVDDVQVGTDPGVLGPLDAGSYRVAAGRECFHVEPTERLVTVVAAETTFVDFALTLAEFGTVRVTAKDELTGAAIDGAEVLRETAPGVYESTGLTTPALVDSVACGVARFRAAKSGFETSPIVEANVDTGIESQTEAELGPLRGTLLEMFTYALCPNCPYAADSIHAVRDDFPNRAYAIEWHSGASQAFFILYDAQWKAREVFYTGGSTVGYPATSVGGELPLLVGGQSSDLSEYRPRTQQALDACANDCPIALRLEGTIGASSADLTARVKWRGGVLPGGLKLRFVLIENDVFAPGNEPEGFDFVARVVDERTLSFASPGEVQVIPSTIPIQDWPPAGSGNDFEAVAIIQSDVTREVLQVSGIP